MMESEERLTMTVKEAGETLGISRATAYLLANSGQIPVIRLGERRLVVPRAALLKMLENLAKPKDSII
ncbi:MAG: helix-turn-helix domain-containing protein [Dehalococcoidales bacterium]